MPVSWSARAILLSVIASLGCVKAGEPFAARTNHWAFQPSTIIAPPALSNRARPRNPIDAFLLARLEREGIAPSPEADRRTLIRRLAFDLTGLPPTPGQVADFAADGRPDAYERLVDAFLASPHYGERWARHWLDVVHFGETHGYDKDKPRPNAWPYRDYVIRSFNSDKPYTRFVQEQIAGDALFPDDPDGVVALGFIAAGPWDFVGHVELPESKTDGLIARYNDRDDMVMSTMSTFLSLTVHCARCHDHKFDPITSREYYRLQAVFAGVDRADRVYDPDPAIHRQRRTLLARKRESERRQEVRRTRAAALRSPDLENAVAALDQAKTVLKTFDTAGGSPSNGYHSEIAAQADTIKWVQIDLGEPRIIDAVRLLPARPTDYTDTPGFGFPRRFRVAVSDDPQFAHATALVDHTSSDFPNPGDSAVVAPAGGRRARYVRVTAEQLWERTADYVFALGEAEVISGSSNIALGATVTALDSIESGRWSRKALVDGFDSRKRVVSPRPGMVREDAAEAVKAAEERERAARLALLPAGWAAEDAALAARAAEIRAELEALPEPHAVYAAASDFPSNGNFVAPGVPRPVQVLARGNVLDPREPAPPGTLASLPGMTDDLALEPDAPESARRAALARWMTSRQNGLLRRSIVNRIWQGHFGRGLVDTPNDFGHLGSAPSHLDLLDWLAGWFQSHGESVKAVHRLIVTSAAYRQTSSRRPDAERLDADNRLVWRQERARLDAESLHDAILAVSGHWDARMGGPSDRQFWFKDDHSPTYDYSQFDIESPATRRRSIYRFLVRSVPDPFMETMDCPDPSVLAGRRNVTLTPLQALAQLNDPFVLGAAQHLADRLHAASPEIDRQIEIAFQLCFARPPSPRETGIFGSYAQRYGLANLCRVLFNANEFVFID